MADRDLSRYRIMASYVLITFRTGGNNGYELKHSKILFLRAEKN